MLGLRSVVLNAGSVDRDALHMQAERAVQLQQVWRRAVAVIDEVDVVLHPLRSELNWPLGDKYAPCAAYYGHANYRPRVLWPRVLWPRVPYGGTLSHQVRARLCTGALGVTVAPPRRRALTPTRAGRHLRLRLRLRLRLHGSRADAGRGRLGRRQGDGGALKATPNPNPDPDPNPDPNPNPNPKP